VEALMTLRARMSLGDSTEVSSNEALLINSGWSSGDKDVSMCLKIEEIGIVRCVIVDSIPADG